jgi:hypothetical protein
LDRLKKWTGLLIEDGYSASSSHSRKPSRSRHRITEIQDHRGIIAALSKKARTGAFSFCSQAKKHALAALE